MMATNILTAEQVRARTGLSTKKIYALTRAGKIPFFQYPDSRLYFYRAEKIDDWVDELSKSRKGVGQ